MTFKIFYVLDHDGLGLIPYQYFLSVQSRRSNLCLMNGQFL